MQVKLVIYISKEDGTKPKDESKNILKDVLKELSERQRVIVQLIENDASMTWAEMSERLNVSTKSIQRDIEILISKGIFVREGGRKEDRWVVKYNKE